MLIKLSRLLKICVLLVWSSVVQSAPLPILFDVELAPFGYVNFYATDAFAAMNDSSTNTFEGVILEGFYQSDLADMGVITDMAIRPSGTSTLYDTIVQFPTGRDLNIYNSDFQTPEQQIFTTSQQALWGSFTMNEAVNAGNGWLPTAGMSGNIITGGFDGVVIGQWQVEPVPVPAAVWLFGSGLIGLIGIARRKKA